MLDAWRLSVGTLTAVRVRPPSRVDPGTARTAVLLAPLAVVPLGLAATALCLAGRGLGLPSSVVAVLVVGSLAAGTRAMHLDGLSDTADGLAASYDPARSLTVMRSGSSGPAGVVAVVVVLGAQVTALAALAASVGGAVLAGVAVCASRCALALCCVPGLRSARPDGLGAVFTGTVPAPSAAATWTLATVLLSAVSAWAGLEWWRGPVAVALALGVVGLLLHRAVRRLGGVTGDVFGAAVELALAALLVSLS